MAKSKLKKMDDTIDRMFKKTAEKGKDDERQTTTEIDSMIQPPADDHPLAPGGVLGPTTPIGEVSTIDDPTKMVSAPLPDADDATPTTAPAAGILFDQLTPEQKALLLQEARQVDQQQRQEAKRTKRPVVLVTPARLQAIKDRAAADGVSTSEVINRALDMYLGREG